MLLSSYVSLSLSLFLFNTLSTHTDKIGARDEYVISLQMLRASYIFISTKSTFRLESPYVLQIAHSSFHWRDWVN